MLLSQRHHCEDIFTALLIEGEEQVRQAHGLVVQCVLNDSAGPAKAVLFDVGHQAVKSSIIRCLCLVGVGHHVGFLSVNECTLGAIFLAVICPYPMVDP